MQVDTSERSFNQAWQKLTTEGEMSPENAPQNFTPIGIRKNVKEEGPLYHGTKADLQVGDHLKPGYPSNYGTRKTANFVYVTAIEDGAALAAELAVGEGDGRVYIVEPTGPIEDDPNVTDKKFPGNPSRSYRTREPVRIVGEVHDRKHLPEEALAKIRKRMEEAARSGIEAINE